MNGHRTYDDSTGAPRPAERAPLDRRTLLSLLAAASVSAACSRMPGEMMGRGGMMDEGPMAGSDMRVIHSLLSRHDTIERTVQDVKGGIRSVTTSDDAEVAELIRTHVAQMKSRLENDQPIRQMDPLFREIFKHAAAIDLCVDDTTGGVAVIETSSDPHVTMLIRQHARRAVSEFVEDGMRRAMQPTPLPDGYE